MLLQVTMPLLSWSVARYNDARCGQRTSSCSHFTARCKVVNTSVERQYLSSSGT